MSSKDGSSEAFTFSKPFHFTQHRPSSLPTLPLSPLALEQSSSPSSCGEGGMLTRSLQTSACKNLIKQISSPLVSFEIHCHKIFHVSEFLYFFRKRCPLLPPLAGFMVHSPLSVPPVWQAVHTQRPSAMATSLRCLKEMR